jgi:hypothetical protein
MRKNDKHGNKHTQGKKEVAIKRGREIGTKANLKKHQLEYESKKMNLTKVFTQQQSSWQPWRPQ